MLVIAHASRLCFAAPLPVLSLAPSRRILVDRADVHGGVFLDAGLRSERNVLRFSALPRCNSQIVNVVEMGVTRYQGQ